MSATVKGLVLKAIKSLLYNTITVSGETVEYYSSAFGDKSSGIFLQSYKADEDGCKTSFSQNITLELSIFSKNKTIDFTTSATEKVMQAIKASVNSTITLGSGYKATYTTIPNVSSYVENDNGLTVHRDILRICVRVDEDETTINNS
jgi:hypothetical protein